jgi:hypothetical protein
MEFDHLPGFEKTNNVGNMKSRSREAILAEIAKCEIVCGNCHRARTWLRGRERYAKVV